MSHRDSDVPLRHMLDHAAEAVQMAEGRERKDLDADRQFSLAMTRLLEFVGEAGNRISSNVQVQLSSIPWQAVIGLRNRLIHGYDDVDFDILWDTVQQDLPPLIRAL